MRDLGLAHPASDATPAITADECEEWRVAICRYHKGRIGQGLVAGDREGNVYFCPVGRSYWRLTKTMNQMMAPLKWPRGM